MYQPSDQLTHEQKLRVCPESKVKLQNMLSVQDILTVIGASVIQQHPVVCNWVALLVFLSIDLCLYCINAT